VSRPQKTAYGWLAPDAERPRSVVAGSVRARQRHGDDIANHQIGLVHHELTGREIHRVALGVSIPPVVTGALAVIDHRTPF
jgi:hypothetical protein